MKTIRFTAAWLVAAAGALAGAAQAHGKLEGSLPVAGSTLSKAPAVIQLTFNEAPEPAFTKIKLSDGAGRDIPLPRPSLNQPDRKIVEVTLPALQASLYRVQWSTVTHDGHKTKGQFTFTVK